MVSGGVIMPSSTLRSVVLPQPDSPAIPYTSPSWIWREMSSTARTVRCTLDVEVA